MQVLEGKIGWKMSSKRKLLSTAISNSLKREANTIMAWYSEEDMKILTQGKEYSPKATPEWNMFIRG